ncbi:MAG: iron transporter substrate-binding protein [Hyphomicrobiales bacterium]|nr:iron transporter substrate-binding protein [Hyphomicrobiales bacterium]
MEDMILTHARALKSLISAAALLGIGSLSAMAQQVNLYTVREPGLVKPLAEAFTAKSGIKVNTVFLKDGLAERVAAEGERSPADVLMTVDIGNLVDIVEKGVAQPVKSAALESAIPAQLRDASGQWFAVSLRARLVYASKERVKDTAITYEDLADPKWKGKVCIRSGQHQYNIALIAAHIAHHGEAATETWLKGVKANLARKAGGGDREVARDILGGLCDVGVGNSYYVGLMRSGAGGPDQKKWGDAINVLLPKFKNGATHVNASGVAVAKHAPNRDNAVKFLEFLVSDEGQKIYSEANFEYPVKAGAQAHPIVAALGKLEPDTLSLSEIAKHRKAASVLVDRVGFDN